MNTTTQRFPRTSKSGYEYAAAIEKKRRRDYSGQIIIFAFCISIMAGAYLLGWASI